MVVTTKEINNDVYLYYKNGKKNKIKLESNTEYNIPVNKAYIKIYDNNFNTKAKKAKCILKGILFGIFLLAIDIFGSIGSYENFLVRKYVIKDKDNVVLDFTYGGKLSDETIAKEKPYAIFIEGFSNIISLLLLMAIIFVIIMIVELNKK